MTERPNIKISEEITLSIGGPIADIIRMRREAERELTKSYDSFRFYNPSSKQYRSLR